MLALWLVVACLSASRHELWRDEVHAISLVEHAKSPTEIPARIVGEGHPVLWFAVIELARRVRGRSSGLPWLSVAIGAVAVGFFIWNSPFPLWFKALFAFGILPAYEYTVMFRPYGLTMLLAFFSAGAFTRRQSRPFVLAVPLALLANSTLPGFICAVGFGGLWIVDRRNAQPSLPAPAWRHVAALLLVVAALAGSAWTMRPPTDSVLPVRLMSWPDAVIESLTHPEFTLSKLVPHADAHFPDLLSTRPPLWVMDGVIVCGLVGLLGEPWLAAAGLGVLVALGLTIRLFFELELRHQGFYFVFLVCLYWIHRERAGGAAAKSRVSRILSGVGMAGVVAIALSLLLMTPRTMWADWERPMSANEAFGQFLTDTPQFRNAIVMAEPDAYIESLAYYAPNPIFMPRERRFSKVISTRAINRPVLTLKELLDDATGMRQPDQEVLVAIGYSRFEEDPAHRINWWRNKAFEWTDADLVRLRAVAEPVAAYWWSTTDENFTVFRIK